MIRSIATISSAHAKSYYTSALQPTGYYINEQEAQGTWHGLLKTRLGVSGFTDRETFFALIDNKHPVTGETLTPRHKDHRIIAWDVSFHAPKAVSLAHVLSGNAHISDAFQEAITETMTEIERDMMTRVRRNGKDEDRYTGELIYGAFLHQTARPAKGAVSDPHLHQHNVLLNLTWDRTESRFKAAQCREINRNLPYFQARFHKRFADKLMGMGYKIKHGPKGWDIDGIPEHIVAMFKKRTNEIGVFAAEHGITSAKELDKLGARTRSKKNKDWSMDELRSEWRRQIREASVGNADQGEMIVRHKEPIKSPTLDPQHVVDYAAAHRFERLSTISDRRLLETAYRYAIGNNSVSLDDITNAFEKDESFIRLKDGYQTMYTKKHVLAEEKQMVMLARNGQGQFKPLYSDLPEIGLDGQQRNAVAHILTTTNLASIVRGVAGAGKTTALKDLDKHLKAAGKQAFYFAPTGEASRNNLAKEGFTDADTVAALLASPEKQAKLQNQFLIVDEAGMIGTSDLKQLLAIATKQKARLVLIGDEQQHNSVSRGSGLKILRTFGKIKSASIDKIRRQRSEQYRSAVQDLADGKVKSAFGKLADINAIKQIDPLNPNSELVADYLAATKRRKSVLIVSPTHKQGNSVTKDVRQALQDAGLLGKRETSALKLSSLNLTEAQKTDWRNYRAGQVIQFGLPAPQFKRGSVWTIEDIKSGNVMLIDKTGNRKLLPLDKAKAFDLFEPTKINLAKGDKVRITKGAFDQQNKRLNNGQSFEVVSFNKSGIKMRNRESKATYTVNPDFGHIDHAYCTTSHASQGRTCDEIFVSLPASTYTAADSKMMYVSVSRGRDMCTIYTDDTEELLEYAERSGNRLSALELVARAKTKHQPRPEPIHVTAPGRHLTPNKEQPVNRPNRHIDYEP